MHPRAASLGEPVSRLALQAAISVLPCWSRAGSSAILRPSVLAHAISAIGGVVTMGGVVAQPSNGISMAVKHNAEIHSDITGIILRLITPHSSLGQQFAHLLRIALVGPRRTKHMAACVLTTSLLHRFPILKGSFDRKDTPTRY